MKKFKFRLQTALNLRQQREDQLRGELAQIQMRHQQEYLRLEQWNAEREAEVEHTASGRTGRMDPEKIRAREQYHAALEERIATQQQLVSMVERELQQKLVEVITASQETQALETLRDQQAEAHRREDLREEQKFLDELASIRAARQSREAA